jgi:hypothetical protein
MAAEVNLRAAPFRWADDILIAEPIERMVAQSNDNLFVSPSSG